MVQNKEFMMFSVNPKNKEKSCVTEGDNCCSAQPKGKVECPECAQKAKGVLAKTLQSLLKDETKEKLNCLDGFYYCKTATCRVVYFKADEILTQEDISVVVGLKNAASPATLCYCFEWSKEKIEAELKNTGTTVALEDIKEKMENPGCACEVLNPSGGCCLGDVTHGIKELKTKLGFSS